MAYFFRKLFKDYVYITIGRKQKYRIRNLFIVWTLTGLWHGADWNFVIWGLYYFVLLVIEKAFLLKFLKNSRNNIKIIPVVATLVGWVFFYHNDIGQAFRFWGLCLDGAKEISGPELNIHILE